MTEERAITELEFTDEEARRIGVALGVDWATAPFDPDELRLGIGFELEEAGHPAVELSDEDELKAFRAAVTRLEEHPDHYSRMERQEAERRAYSESL